MKQAFRHDPPNTYGDCHRTACAMILGKERDEVPHFFADGPEHYDRHWLKWLEDEGLTAIDFAFPGNATLQDILYTRSDCSMPFILGCSSEVANHSVAVIDGVIHNPSLTSDTIKGPCDDGFWWITYLVRRP